MAIHPSGAFVTPNGNKLYWLDGQRHRTDGPAVEWVNGHKSWYLNDIRYSFEEYVVKAGWTDEQVVMYKLEFG